jgi:hypothetical protein
MLKRGAVGDEVGDELEEVVEDFRGSVFELPLTARRMEPPRSRRPE